MKPLLISTTFAATMFCGMLYISHAKIPVKYSQYFADKQITLTEKLTMGERFLILPKKKGFICFEE